MGHGPYQFLENERITESSKPYSFKGARLPHDEKFLVVYFCN
jgi:hypothetical protein